MEVGCLRHPGASTIWQPVPRWRLLPWLANPGNPAMSHHTVRGTGTCHTVETVERGRERGGRGTAWAMSCHTTKRQRTPPVRNATLWSTSTWNSDTCAYVTTPLTTNGTQALFVVNSIKLYLTALNGNYMYYNMTVVLLLFVLFSFIQDSFLVGHLLSR